MRNVSYSVLRKAAELKEGFKLTTNKILQI